MSHKTNEAFALAFQKVISDIIEKYDLPKTETFVFASEQFTRHLLGDDAVEAIKEAKKEFDKKHENKKTL